MRTRRTLTALLVAGACAVTTGCGDGGGGGSASSSAGPAAIGITASAAPAATSIGRDFVGIVSEDAFAAGPAERRRILAGQRRTGVALIRQTFDWSQIERRHGRFEFGRYDSWMAATARAGIDVLPILFRPPSFERAARNPGARITATTTFPPRSAGRFARFAGRLVRRYGPQGSYWRAHPDVPRRPIRAWQVWNEPNLPAYWGGKPDADAYAALLKATATAIHQADPRGEVVTAGLPDSRQGVPLVPYLRALLAAGAGRSMDTLALHPYAADTAGTLAALRQVRLVLNANAVRAPIWITELGWASGGPPSSFTVGARRQAKLVLDAITTLAQAAGTLGVRGVVYFNWRDSRPYAGGKDFWGLHTGLLRLSGDGKPALSAFFQAAGNVERLRASKKP